MSHSLIGRLSLALCLVSATLTVGCSKGASGAQTGASGAALSEDGYAMGNKDAKVTVVEYASASCSHCARWDAEVFPPFKAKYIDSGKVRYIYREFITPPEQYAAAAFLLARCAGPDKYFSVVEAAYRGQAEMFANQDMRGPLLKAAQSAGMNESQFNTCVSDPKALQALQARVQKAIDTAKVTGTPTIEVNGKRLNGSDGGEQTMAQLDAAIQPLLAKK